MINTLTLRPSATTATPFLPPQADWLLHNIIPNHVTSKKTFTKALPQDYSENHRDIGVVFANLVNFNELGRRSVLQWKSFLSLSNA